MNQFFDKPVIPTPAAVALIVALVAFKWAFFPEDDLDLIEDEPVAVEPAPQPMLNADALEAALAAANCWPIKAATLLVVPCDPPARPMLIGTGTQVQSTAASQYCVVELDTE